MKNHLSEEILKRYRSKLPYGAIKEIMEDTGYCRTSIFNFLKGKNYNPEIEKVILQKITKIKRDREVLLKEAGLL